MELSDDDKDIIDKLSDDDKDIIDNTMELSDDDKDIIDNTLEILNEHGRTAFEYLSLQLKNVLNSEAGEWIIEAGKELMESEDEGD